jgi:hypothetical protein
MIVFLIFLSLLLWGGVVGVVSSIVGVSIYLLLSIFSASNVFTTVLASVLSISLASLLCSELLMKFGFGKLHCKSIQALCFILPLAIGSFSPTGWDFLVAAIQVNINQANTFSIITVMLLLIEKILFCGALAAFVVMVLVLIFKLPFLWFCNAVGFERKPSISLQGVVPMMIVGIVALGFEIISAYFLGELWPKIGY